MPNEADRRLGILPEAPASISPESNSSILDKPGLGQIGLIEEPAVWLCNKPAAGFGSVLAVAHDGFRRGAHCEVRLFSFVA